MGTFQLETPGYGDQVVHLPQQFWVAGPKVQNSDFRMRKGLDR